MDGWIGGIVRCRTVLRVGSRAAASLGWRQIRCTARLTEGCTTRVVLAVVPAVEGAGLVAAGSLVSSTPHRYAPCPICHGWVSLQWHTTASRSATTDGPSIELITTFRVLGKVGYER